MGTRDYPAICPVCDGALYIEISDDSDENEAVECAYCHSMIRAGTALAKYNRIVNGDLKESVEHKPEGLLTLIGLRSPDVEAFTLTFISGRERITDNTRQTIVKMNCHKGTPGIVWFDGNRDREFEVIGYEWDGPKYQDVTKSTNGLRNSWYSYNRISSDRSRSSKQYETVEVPVAAYMKLRNITKDSVIDISFKCTADLDARIRNYVTCNLEAAEYIDHHEMSSQHEMVQPKTNVSDVISQIKELKELLDNGAITEEEFTILKKRLFES